MKPETVLSAVGGVLARLRRDTLTPMQTKIDALEARLASLEAMPIKFCGVFESGITYQERSLVVSDGSLWFARQSTLTKPGNSSSWQLVCKQGTFSERPRVRTASPPRHTGNGIARPQQP